MLVQLPCDPETRRMSGKVFAGPSIEGGLVLEVTDKEGTLLVRMFLSDRDMSRAVVAATIHDTPQQIIEAEILTGGDCA